jgi:rhodanese-related sulfurtransferase
MTEPLSPQALHAALDTDDPLALLDVRDSLDYVEGHVPDCTFVPRRDLERRLPALVPNRATPIVLCDRRGDRAPRDARWLTELGYEDVSTLDGGVEAWAEAGLDLVEAVGHVHATALNYTSKRFGERVAAERELPTIGPSELADLRDRAEPLVIDVRNPEEYHRWGTVPGAVNVEGVDLALYAEELRDDDQPIVVNCAGRTRSIIGTATLDALGVSEVYELENGTMGWQLAGHDLADGPGRPTGGSPDAERVARLREAAEALLDDAGVSRLSPAALATLPESVPPTQSVYVIDVRREAEYDSGHLPDAIHVPGGQLIQTAEAHLAVRDAEIVLVSETHVRSAITAYWLAEMGFGRVSVLDGGIEAWTDGGRPLVEGSDAPERIDADLVDERVAYVDPQTLAARLEHEAVTVVDIDDSEAFLDAHVPGARWTSRYDLDADLESGAVDAADPIVLSCRDGSRSASAAAALGAAVEGLDVAVLRGGVDAWREAGFPTDSGEEGVVRAPRRAERKPYGQGRAEMRQYLDWEEGLVEGE